MKRREFIAALGGAAAAWPLAARAQQPARLGILVLGNPDPELFIGEFRGGLHKLGYVEGKNILFQLRSAGGKPNLLPAMAAELVALKVDIIVTFQTPAATAAKQATNEIPIVMGTAGDPIGTGLIASLARPGGNVTGVSGGSAELGGKNLELIRELLLSTRRVAVLANSADPLHIPFVEHIEGAGRTLGIDIKTILVGSTEQLVTAFAEIRSVRADAVFVQSSLPNKAAADLALKHRLPAVSSNSIFPRTGGLMSYSADLPALYRETAIFVDKILKGRKPADLPVQLATKFRLVVNLKTAKALGITVPPTLLARADEVIE